MSMQVIKYPHCPIGIEYCRNRILKSLYEYIRKGRAETIKEAINLLENDRYNADMMKVATINAQVNTINAASNVARLL